MPSKIDWGRVKNIAVHLKDWMAENNYELIDIERACAYITAPGHIHKSSDSTTKANEVK